MEAEEKEKEKGGRVGDAKGCVRESNKAENREESDEARCRKRGNERKEGGGIEEEREQRM